MERLSDFLLESAGRTRRRIQSTTVELRDRRTGQALRVTNDGALAGFDLEKAEWGEGQPHTDGVLVGDLDGEVVVVFVELTGSLSDTPKEAGKETPAQHKLRQLTGAVRHFHPGRDQRDGDAHHERFASGADPVEPRPLVAHRVLAIAVAGRQGSRLPTPPLVIGSATVVRQFRSVSHPPRQVPTISLGDLVNP
ncbi:MAG: hypothetical protein HY901_10865 [Deltaproteobacteria bacterium]|nr:hypothetical protein [Deltaproteobacteria bacterium]